MDSRMKFAALGVLVAGLFGVGIVYVLMTTDADFELTEPAFTAEEIDEMAEALDQQEEHDEIEQPDGLESPHDDKPDGAKTVVFVGSSHIYHNRVPFMLEHLSTSPRSEQPIWAEFYTSGQTALSEHLDDGIVEDLLHKHQPEVLVVQELSSKPVHNPERMVENLREVVELAETYDARPVLFQTWAPAADSEYYHGEHTPEGPERYVAKLEVTTQRVVEATDIEVAAVGSAFEKALDWDLRADLYEWDRRHANEVGAYLAAMMLYRTIVGENAGGRAWRPEVVIEDDAMRLMGVVDALHE